MPYANPEARAKSLRDWSSRRWAFVRAHALCGRCKGAPREDGYSTCRRCRKRAVLANRRYFVRKGTTRCSECGKRGHNKVTCPEARIAGLGARCRCGLLLPCNDCIPSAVEAGARRVGWE